jgi:hypothetical protein
MSVTLTISKTVAGTADADTLAGSGTGIDLGSVVNGEYVPIITKSANTGKQTLYVKHNAAIDPITSFGTFIAVYSQTYGGAATAAGDFSTLVSKGNASGNSANNNDGLSSGLRVEHGADLGSTLGASAFDGTRAQVKIYGKSNTQGIDLASAFLMHVDAATYYNGTTEVVATTPVTGKIGISTDTVLGNRGHYSFRYYLETAAPDGGIIQGDLVFKYSFTA